jgi:septal ring factor EnvC (AmiA/AmiB activator)
MSFFELNPNFREQFAEQRAQNEARLKASIVEQQKLKERVNADLKARSDKAAERAEQPPHVNIYNLIREEMAARNTKEDGPTLEERLRTSR